MTEPKRKNISPSVALRLNKTDKAELRNLAAKLNRTQVDTVRILVREAHLILPELKARAMSHPLPKVGRPRKYQTT